VYNDKVIDKPLAGYAGGLFYYKRGASPHKKMKRLIAITIILFFILQSILGLPLVVGQACLPLACCQGSDMQTLRPQAARTTIDIEFADNFPDNIYASDFLKDRIIVYRNFEGPGIGRQQITLKVKEISELTDQERLAVIQSLSDWTDCELQAKHDLLINKVVSYLRGEIVELQRAFYPGKSRIYVTLSDANANGKNRIDVEGFIATTDDTYGADIVCWEIKPDNRKPAERSEADILRMELKLILQGPAKPAREPRFIGVGHQLLFYVLHRESMRYRGPIGFNIISRHELAADGLDIEKRYFPDELLVPMQERSERTLNLLKDAASSPNGDSAKAILAGLTLDEPAKAKSAGVGNSARSAIDERVRSIIAGEAETNRLFKRAAAISSPISLSHLGNPERDAIVYLHNSFADTLAPKDLDAVCQAIMTNHERQDNRRRLFHELGRQTEVSFRGDTIVATMAYMKGVLYDERKAIVRHMGNANVKIVRKSNRDGSITEVESIGNPDGGALLEEVLREFLVTDELFFSPKGPEAMVPLGWVVFPNSRYRNGRELSMGCLIFGVNRQLVRRFVLRKKDMEPRADRLRRRNSYVTGFMLGRLHQIGITHPFLHMGNANNSAVFDLGDSKTMKIDNMTEWEFLAQRIIDLRYLIKWYRFDKASVIRGYMDSIGAPFQIFKDEPSDIGFRKYWEGLGFKWDRNMLAFDILTRISDLYDAALSGKLPEMRDDIFLRFICQDIVDSSHADGRSSPPMRASDDMQQRSANREWKAISCQA